MKCVKKLLGRSYYVFFMMLLFSVPAFAYLDPGTVSYVVSMIAGLFIAGGAAIAIFRRKIKLFFQNLGKKKKGEAPLFQRRETMPSIPWMRSTPWQRWPILWTRSIPWQRWQILWKKNPITGTEPFCVQRQR